MIKMFDAFRRWCDANGVPADQIEITVAPISAAAAERLEGAWHRETRGLTMRPAAYQLPSSGHIYGIPFRYQRPESRRPFVNAGG